MTVRRRPPGRGPAGGPHAGGAWPGGPGPGVPQWPLPGRALAPPGAPGRPRRPGLGSPWHWHLDHVPPDSEGRRRPGATIRVTHRPPGCRAGRGRPRAQQRACQCGRGRPAGGGGSTGSSESGESGGWAGPGASDPSPQAAGGLPSPTIFLKPASHGGHLGRPPGVQVRGPSTATVGHWHGPSRHLSHGVSHRDGRRSPACG